MQFTPQAEGWRWSGRIEDRIVKIEFLCDLHHQPAEAIIRPVGCSQLRAVNLRGTGYVERDCHEYILHIPEGDPHVQIAGLAGYLLSKSAAARTRGADKDYYDLAYVLLYNSAGGPIQAANVVKASPLADALSGLGSTFVEIRERFRNDRAHGARAYAREALRVTPEDDERILAADAAAAVNEFLDALAR